MNKVVLKAIAHKHLTLSILCETATLQNLKIPLDENDPDGWIGKQTDLVSPKTEV